MAVTMTRVVEAAAFIPASDPGKEGGIVLGSEHVGPEVRASRGGDGGEDLGHAGADDECCRWSVEAQR